jgi:hypothetical protein
MNRRSSYKVTFFDRHGPAGVVLLQAFRNGCIALGAGLLMFPVVGYEKLGLTGWSLILFTLVCALTLASAGALVGLQMGEAAGDVASRVYMGGDGTPYEEQFSQEQALVMQRDYAGALALYEQRITMSPGEPRVRIAAADLYMTHGENPKRAAELYREVQRIPELPSGHDVYVTNKLADLYLGPLEEPGRALVEFRRLAYRYPESKAAKFALMAIANLKPDIVKRPSQSKS